MIKVVAIDDNELALINIERVCSKVDEVEYVGSFSDSIRFREEINQHRPDIALLDIEMPIASGFEIALEMEKMGMQYAFLTSHEEMALRAFDFSPIHFLTKPLDEDKLQALVRKYKARQKELLVDADTDKAELTRKGINTNDYPKRIFVNTLNQISVLNVDDIIYMRSDVNYTQIFRTNHPKLVSSRTLKYYTNLLSGHPDFIRVHRSALINRKYIRSIVKGKFTFFLEMSDDQMIEIAPLRKDAVFNAIMF